MSTQNEEQGSWADLTFPEAMLAVPGWLCRMAEEVRVEVLEVYRQEAYKDHWFCLHVADETWKGFARRGVDAHIPQSDGHLFVLVGERFIVDLWDIDRTTNAYPTVVAARARIWDRDDPSLAGSGDYTILEPED